MKKITLFLAMIALLASCKQENKSKLEKEIISYQKEASKLNAKISNLQQQIDEQEKKKNQLTGLKVRIAVDTLNPQLFRHYFDASASVESIHEAFISPEVSGQVEKVLVNEGDKVSKGQLLAQLSTDMIQNNIQEVKASLSLAEFTYKKQKSLWDKHIGSELDYVRAKSNMESLQSKLKSLETQYDKSFIRAPISGYVDAIDVKVGELASPGIRIFHVVNIEDLYVNAQISENYLPVVHKGDKVSVSFPTYPDIELHEKVFRTGEVILAQNRTFKLQLKIKNRNNLFKPNMLAIISINDYSNPKALVVPSFVIRKDIKGDYLFLVKKDKEGQKIAHKQYVTTGLSSGPYTQVVKGVQPGDVVVTDGFNNVTEGTIVIY
ncbi:MAG: efflux RND transporter periplasmic adaptor subunit [Bacteroidales bacterium]|nr:efflux RND transporter periplasmic adaptor subunit [Bacteroidales bacterium]